MANMKTWLASAVLVGGAGGAGAYVLAATSGPAAPSAVPPATLPVAATDSGNLTRQTSALLADDRALQRAVASARKRLGHEVGASEHSLAVLRQRLLATEAALTQAQAARAALGAAPARVAVAAAPVSHATTGASGAGARGGSAEGGGFDD